MSVLRLAPSRANGDAIAPPSKSYTHRALAIGHLAHRTFRVIRPLDSEDTRATARGLAALGTSVSVSHDVWTLTPKDSARRRSRKTIDCGESGTTLRFLTALAALSSQSTILRGRGRLPERPMQGLLRALESLGASWHHDRDRGDLWIRGPIHSGSIELDASTTSQFASALLLVLPTLDGDSVVELTGPMVSLPYIEATLAVLARHRVRVIRRRRTLRVPGAQRYAGSHFRPPGDVSSAAYLWAAAALTGGRVRVRGIDDALPQADRVILSLLEQTGATVVRRTDGATVTGKSHLPFLVDLTDAPDLYPLAGVIAASIPGRSEIRGAPHVALKESDRGAETRRLARAFGARVRPAGNGIAIEGNAALRPVRLPSLSDHRLVMSAAVGALAATGPSVLGDPRAVAKSFPEFWRVLDRLAGRDPS